MGMALMSCPKKIFGVMSRGLGYWLWQIRFANCVIVLGMQILWFGVLRCSIRNYIYKLTGYNFL
ncbi:hypothetical protein PN36_32070 [Candidatus Thiomargarita nelsonii]|uniref:Uncharacterized protein n=1 Tax=Candidatus Thiomargarita nelsonii TaxID=1003181 RepID=A0A4E0QMR2_9GAMM|nr:hypothetical protein PN36_32070 [Candidatus Thiomargarita nelsonii]